MSAAPITPVILAGGSGVRLWPLSRLDRPKQLVALHGGGTLLQQTAQRVSDPDCFAPPVVVAAAAQADAVEDQLEAAGTPPRLLILEPEPRGTAAAVALAAIASPRALLLVLPSDHVVGDEAAFRRAVAAALGPAEAGKLVCLGAEPDRAETGYGWIRRGEPLGAGAWAAASFREKPDRAAAEAMLAEGGWLWNAGIFLFRAGTLLDALEALAPDLLAGARRAMEKASIEGETLRPDSAAFAVIPSASLDRAVMERSGDVAVVPAAMGWSDLGSWAAIHAFGPADPAGNVLAGDVVAPGSRNCLVRSEGPTVVALGVDHLAIVATDRAVLVVPLDETQRIQEALDALEARRGRE
ncbi:MAG: mannose-phosphate guanylyltransferase [Sphingomonadales bacterium]|jgi:mannose-1-phosphate guanylyltransferase/mannose-1-phosphate guanylyltransferase/mannose-6-phosphate isomerase|nr:mannose-phosphate guanylyltransferase [Sphingomonadales bacterium]